MSAILPVTQPDAGLNRPAKAPQAQATGCRIWLGRNWNLSLPTTSLLSGAGALGAAFAGAGATATGVLATIAAAAGVASCIVMGCQNARPSAQELLDQLDNAVAAEREMGSDVQATAANVHAIAIHIHDDQTALQTLQQKAEASEKEVIRLADELEQTSAKLRDLQPLYEKLQGVLRGIQQQTGVMEDAHHEQARAAAILADGVTGIAKDAADLSDIHTHLQDATQAAATKNHELGVSIQSFTTLVRDLITANESLLRKSAAVQEEILQAKAVKEENHRLAGEAKKLKSQITSLETKLRSFQGLDAINVQDILGFLKENAETFRSYIQKQLDAADS